MPDGPIMEDDEPNQWIACPHGEQFAYYCRVCRPPILIESVDKLAIRNKVADFTFDGKTLQVMEACDECFSADLNADDVSRLIAWLVQVRERMT